MKTLSRKERMDAPVSLIKRYCQGALAPDARLDDFMANVYMNMARTKSGCDNLEVRYHVPYIRLVCRAG